MPRQQLCGASEKLALAWRWPVSHIGLGYWSEHIVQVTIRIILSEEKVNEMYLCAPLKGASCSANLKDAKQASKHPFK